MPNKKNKKNKNKEDEAPPPNIPGLSPSSGGSRSGESSSSSSPTKHVSGITGPRRPQQPPIQPSVPSSSQQLPQGSLKGSAGDSSSSASPKNQPQPESVPSGAVSKMSLTSSPRQPIEIPPPSGDSAPSLVPPKKRLSVGGKKPLFPGTSGRECRLRVNHVRMKVPEGPIYQYSLVIVPPWKRPYKKADKDIYQAVIQKWRSINVVAKKNPWCWVYDGNTTLYCTQLHDSIPNCEIELNLEGTETSFQVTDVKYDATILISQDLADWASRGQSGSVPQTALSAINIILSQSRTLDMNYISIGKSSFKKPRPGEVLDLGFGKEVWHGVFSSVRPHSWSEAGTRYLATLNANVVNKAATKEMKLVLDQSLSYVDEVLDRKGNNGRWKNGMDRTQMDILNKDLKGLKIRYELPDGRKREYRCNEVMNQPANKLIVPDLKVSVEQYFKDTYKKKLKYPNLPCLWLGSRNKTIYIPLEFCEVRSQPLPRSKPLTDTAQAVMIRNTAMKPGERERKIMEDLKANNNMYKNDKFAKEFKIGIADNLVQLTGRILPPPSIEYQGKKEVPVDPRKPGSWFQGRGNRYVSGGELNNWAVLDLAGLHPNEYSSLIAEFGKVGGQVGMKIQCNDGQNVFYYQSQEEQAGKMFVQILQDFQKFKTKLDLILVIFAFKGGRVYNEIKQLGDIQHKVPTQCCVKKVLFDPRNNQPKGQVISNICLKINSKLSGTNHMLSRGSRPQIFNEPIMILGADVTHAAAQFKSVKPSIAAVVGSVDPTAQMKYEVEIRVQEADQNEEMIQDMKNIIKSLLIKFHRGTKQKPSRLIMFRDGVSEGQFQTVMARELTAIRNACLEIQKDQQYRPRITYIVVQKRHHTRFFPADGNKYDKNGNALAGTVVDQGINHPTEGDYYLLSHEGIQGTSRPCHYQVLWDDSNMSANDLESLSYYLCHLYSRCTKSVSYPAPTYYSHLAADRARKHHDHLTDMEKKRPEEAKRILEEAAYNLMHFV